MRLIKENFPPHLLLKEMNINHDLEITDDIQGVCGLSELGKGLLTFSSKSIRHPNNEHGLVFAPYESIKLKNLVHVKNPRLEFIKAVSWLQEHIGFKEIQETLIPKCTVIGKNVSIGHGVIIGEKVRIGNNIVIGDYTVIGNRVSIKSGSVIGEDGFGFERDEFGVPMRFPHLGQVLIRDDVEIGSNVTINKGTLDLTIIGNHVKIDDQVHIAHNVVIGDNVLITAGVIIGGGVSVGKGVWLGLNSAVHQKIVIGENAIVGIGANVFTDVLDNTTKAGFPSRTVPK
jgi:acyl-[acyl carrier protein]--UDP-N-acetylglucosamine O-acyltransferase